MLVERELTIQDFEDSLELKFRLAILFYLLVCLFLLFAIVVVLLRSDVLLSMLLQYPSFLHDAFFPLYNSILFFQQFILTYHRPQGSAGPPVPTPPHKLTFAFKFKVLFL